MPLTLTIRNVDSLENGSPRSLVLDGQGAAIGRGATADWCLPDPSRHVSSRHCDIVFRDGRYELVDQSTNGTFLNGSSARLPEAHALQNGDVFVIGPYEIAAALDEQDQAPTLSEPAQGGAVKAESAVALPASPPATPPPAPPAPTAAPAPVSSQVASPDGTNGPAGQRSGSEAGDVWGRFAELNSIDWARGGFGAADQVSSAPPPLAMPDEADSTASASSSDGGIARFLAAVGLSPGELKQPEGEALGQAGMLLRRVIAGLVVMLEARARAKSQMGAAGTGLELAGNNPLKFARTPEQAIAMMLNPAERGFMSAERAVEDSFRDLQAHQMATLKAMQGALRTTLDRFSPKAIRERAGVSGFLAKVFPPLRDAELWRAYESEFSGVAIGSDEAFMDMFAKEFRRAYEDQARLP